MTLLAPYRVLDLTDERGHLAGHILAQLGADVVAVEPPTGNRARHQAPFDGDIGDPERSFAHWSFNRGKRSVVLDLHGSPADRAALERLAAGADILIESGRPGELAALGLGYDDLARDQPRPGDGVDLRLRPDRAQGRLRRERPGGPGRRGLRVDHRRRRPPAAAAVAGAGLPPRGGRRGRGGAGGPVGAPTVGAGPVPRRLGPGLGAAVHAVDRAGRALRGADRGPHRRWPAHAAPRPPPHLALPGRLRHRGLPVRQLDRAVHRPPHGAGCTRPA